MQGTAAMDLSENQLKQIGEYIQEKLPVWIRTYTSQQEPGSVPPAAPAGSVPTALLERMVRVEEELKSQRELMKAGFERMDQRFEDLIHQMDKRFEQMDKRFEQMDKRFEQMDKRFDDLIHHMDKRFEQMDKRFDELLHHMDKRFEQSDKRFEDLHTVANRHFVVISVILGVLTVLVGAGFFVG
jgi:molecular chaperone DnaK (HSP70)